MLLKDILEAIRRKGYKVTPQRRAVILALLSLEKQYTAKEVCQVVQGANPDISLDTVYRNLYLLAELGILTQLNFLSKESTRFELSSSPHHHHFICVRCGEALCLEDCPIDLKSLAKEKNLYITGHAFEIYGYCTACKVK